MSVTLCYATKRCMTRLAVHIFVFIYSYMSYILKSVTVINVQLILFLCNYRHHLPSTIAFVIFFQHHPDLKSRVYIKFFVISLFIACNFIRCKSIILLFFNFFIRIDYVPSQFLLIIYPKKEKKQSKHKNKTKCFSHDNYN